MAAKDRSTIPGVGSTLWVRDGLARVFERDKNGRSIGNPLELPMWKQVFVVGETNVSLLLNPEHDAKWAHMTRKVAKVGFCDGETPADYARNEAERDARIWVKENGFFIGDAVGRVTDPIILARIALLAGYDPRGERKLMPASLLAAVRGEGE